MGITWNVKETIRTVVDIEMEVPSVNNPGYGTDYENLFQLIGAAKGEFRKRTGRTADADNDIQVFVGDDRIVLRFWIDKDPPVQVIETTSTEKG